MSARRALLLTVLPAALLAGPVAGLANADTPTPGPISEAPGTVTFAAAAGHQSPITKVEVDLPTGTPLRDVTVPAMSGWTSATTSAALPSCGDETVNSVTWTATSNGLAPQQSGNFAIQVGSFPKSDQMDFTGVVTYADGSAANWTQTEGIRLPGSALTPQAPETASAVTVSAESAAPRPFAQAAAQPMAPAGNPISNNWMSTLVKTVMSVW